MILQHETEKTHSLSDILTEPKSPCDTPARVGSAPTGTVTWKGDGKWSAKWVKQAVMLQTGYWKSHNKEQHLLPKMKVHTERTVLWHRKMTWTDLWKLDLFLGGKEQSSI